MIHTGQHYDYNMSAAFFVDLGLPKPEAHLGVGSGTHGEQIGRCLMAYEQLLTTRPCPDSVAVVGDVNSTLACTLAATKLGIQVAHLEAGLRSDHQTGTSWGRRGQTPVVPVSGKRFACNMISTVTNRGALRFMVFGKRFTAAVFIRFLERLLKSSPHKVYLIVDRHPVHRSKQVKHWLEEHKEQIRMFFLPSYSPELNPDEYLNNDVKGTVLGRRRSRNLKDLMTNLRSYLHSTQKRPDIVRNYFHAHHVRYAAA